MTQLFTCVVEWLPITAWIWHGVMGLIYKPVRLKIFSGTPPYVLYRRTNIRWSTSFRTDPKATIGSTILTRLLNILPYSWKTKTVLRWRRRKWKVGSSWESNLGTLVLLSELCWGLTRKFSPSEEKPMLSENFLVNPQRSSDGTYWVAVSIETETFSTTCSIWRGLWGLVVVWWLQLGGQSTGISSYKQNKQSVFINID